jgi:UDP-galactopyranose mutase
VEFNRFTESPVAIYKGKAYNLPFNMNTFSQMWGVITPDEAKKKIEEQRKKMEGKEITNLEEQAISLVGRDIYERLIKGYTEKQWGRKCTELPPFIIRRLPVRFVYDNNYFNDSYQGVPIGGYNKLIDGLLAGIDTQVNTDFFANRKKLESLANKIVFTGRIDEFYDFQFGKLDYRTVRFETETLPTSNYQGLAQINYTEAEIPYTRIIEHKHFESFAAEVDKNPQTVISREYSVEWKEGLEPYYPINDEKNSKLYQKYESLAQQENHVIFGGRLAEYKYYDMAPIVEKVLKMFDYC